MTNSEIRTVTREVAEVIENLNTLKLIMSVDRAIFNENKNCFYISFNGWAGNNVEVVSMFKRNITLVLAK